MYNRICNLLDLLEHMLLHFDIDEWCMDQQDLRNKKNNYLLCISLQRMSFTGRTICEYVGSNDNISILEFTVASITVLIFRTNGTYMIDIQWTVRIFINIR